VSHPINGVATSITAFIGSALRGPMDLPGSVNSFADFERLYGGLWAQSTLGYAVQQFFLNGGSQALIVRVEDDGSRNDNGNITDADIIASLPVLDQADLFNLLCIPPLKRHGTPPSPMRNRGAPLSSSIPRNAGPRWTMFSTRPPASRAS
jgi:hypothetical protein